MAHLAHQDHLGMWQTMDQMAMAIEKLGTLRESFFQIIFFSDLIPLICFPSIVPALIARKERRGNETHS